MTIHVPAWLIWLCCGAVGLVIAALVLYVIALLRIARTLLRCVPRW